MVRGIILATAVSLCLSSHCAAGAVRKVHVVDPVEAKKRELQLQLDELNGQIKQLQEATSALLK